MKFKILAIILVLIFSVSSITTLSVNAGVIDPSLYFESYEEFYNAVETAKSDYLLTGQGTASGIEKINEFIDFKKIREEIEFKNIVVNNSVGLNYKEGVYLHSTPASTGYDYVGDVYKRVGGIVEKKTINGLPAVKNIVYDEEEFICNQYHWTQDGYNIFLQIFKGALEKYDEDDFFDIQKIKVPPKSEPTTIVNTTEPESTVIQSTTKDTTQTSNKSPQTGDNSSVFKLITILILSMSIGSIILITKKRKIKN